ncbi:DUF4304 domain-containing protein [Arthrobacter sp. KN11-1C]|uniref:DUF4304 domain-containing protein n=1 Tax=Arthrobacter sp. KN11-1C TaxID=3445774 RepID=UPI003FA0C5E9
MPETVALIERVLASATPPGILDLSVLRDGDTWGAPARDAAREFPAHEVAPLVRLLSTLGPQKPSKSWRRSVLEATSFQTARELLREWLRLAANADIVPPDEHAQLGFSGAMLFAHGNDDLVRSAVFAAQELPHEEWVPELLGILARRGAATSGGQAMTGALALSVASASVDSLAGRASPADKMVLAELFEDLSRRDLVRRIGKYLGLDEDVIAQRDQAIRRAKAAAVRQKADPAPREARAAMDVLVRIHFAPLLKQHGFKARGRTFRRISPDRVDVVAIGSFGLDQFALSYGTRFSTSWPPQDPAHLNEASLDIRHAEQHGIAPDEVQALAKRLSSIIIPFLDSMGRYELVRSYVENGTGAPAGSRGIDGWMGPPAWGFLGLLALAVKDRPAAVTFLTKKYDFTQGLFESNPSYGAELDIWRESLKRAVDLPDSLETGGFGGRADEDTL